MSIPILSAPQLYARALGKKCEGKHRCHWCFSPCSDRDMHDEPPARPFERKKTDAKNPNGFYVCTGCWEFRRKSITAWFLNGGRKDKQAPTNHSWLITLEDARILGVGDEEKLYEFLLNPRDPFCLILKKNECSLIHMALVNAPEKINDKTMLRFTIDNVLFQYSIYELYQGLEHGTDGREPGVRELVSILGECKAVPRRVEEKKGREKRTA